MKGFEAQLSVMSGWRRGLVKEGDIQVFLKVDVLLSEAHTGQTLTAWFPTPLPHSRSTSPPRQVAWRPDWPHRSSPHFTSPRSSPRRQTWNHLLLVALALEYRTSPLFSGPHLARHFTTTFFLVPSSEKFVLIPCGLHFLQCSPWQICPRLLFTAWSSLLSYSLLYRRTCQFSFTYLHYYNIQFFLAVSILPDRTSLPSHYVFVTLLCFLPHRVHSKNLFLPLPLLRTERFMIIENELQWHRKWVS